jgi:hypothetical protein
MSACVIIDVTGGHEWPEFWHGGIRVPEYKRPTVLRLDRPSAEVEAMRLAKANPGRQFAIFEAVSMGITIKVPTHVNIAGKVLVEGATASVVSIGDEDSDGGA